MTPAFWVTWAIGVSLQAVLLQFVLTRRLYRRTPVLSLYIVILFVTGLLDIMLYVDVGGWGHNYSAIRIYWIDDTLRQGGLLLAVLSLMYHIGGRTRRVSAFTRVLGTAAVAAVIVGMIMFDPQRANERWTEAIRNLSFLAVLCNFALWMRLMRNSQLTGDSPDRGDIRLLLALSAGAGVQLAGEAVGQSLRAIGFERHWAGFVTAANYLLVTAHLLCLYVWVLAIRKSPVRPAGYRPGHLSGDSTESGAVVGMCNSD